MYDSNTSITDFGGKMFIPWKSEIVPSFVMGEVVEFEKHVRGTAIGLSL